MLSMAGCMSWIDSEAIVHRGQRPTRVVTAVLGLLSYLGILFPTAHVYGAIYCLTISSPPRPVVCLPGRSPSSYRLAAQTSCGFSCLWVGCCIFWPGCCILWPYRSHWVYGHYCQPGENWEEQTDGGRTDGRIDKEINAKPKVPRRSGAATELGLSS